MSSVQMALLRCCSRGAEQGGECHVSLRDFYQCFCNLETWFGQGVVYGGKMGWLLGFILALGHFFFLFSIAASCLKDGTFS